MRSALFVVVAIFLLWFLGSQLMTPTTDNPDLEIAVEVEGVFVAPGTSAPVILLREQGGDRSLPIWIGFLEAEAIRRRLDEEITPRPMTHDLLGSAITALGGSVRRVVVTDVREGTFYARVDVDASGHDVRLDARPSDAIALALGVNAPIFVSRQVLDEAGAGGDAAQGVIEAIGCGIWCQPLDPELAGALSVESGVIVSDLSPEQATTGPLQRGDVIVELAGQPAENVSRVQELLSGLQAGDTLNVTVMRAGDRVEVQITCR